MGRHSGAGRDMEAICLAQIASMVWRPDTIGRGRS
jgi:hypothetical protein